MLSGGLAVSGGFALAGEAPSPVVHASSELASAPSDRTVATSRSDLRADVDPVKVAALTEESGGQVTKTEELASPSDPKGIARVLMGPYGWGEDQFSCLESLWQKESGWNPRAHNASSGAHGIPQALPGSKMASAGADWATNPATQITWGLEYIKGRYGTPCGAWSHSRARGWY